MKTTISFLTQEETKRLFSAIKTKRDRAIFLTAYRHGLRACEIGYCLRNASVLQPAGSQRTNATLDGVDSPGGDRGVKTILGGGVQ